MNYQNFQILVDKNKNIRASSSQGEVNSELHLDINRTKQTLRLIEHQVKDAELLKGLGRELYQALFPNKINALFKATIAASQAKNDSVRLRLVFESPELAALPWEFLYDGDTNTFLANNTETVLSRYIDIPLPKKDIKATTSILKVLVVISTPTDLGTLDVAGEEQLIREALKKHIDNGQIELDVLTEATSRNIRRKLNENNYNVFHFIGHGDFQNNKGYIVLVNEDGKANLLDDEKFASFFLGNRNLGLVVLNCCRGAMVSANQTFAGTVLNLVQKGIPAVVAMQYTILDSTAKLFADEFYSTLALGYPVDETIQKTRNAISQDVGFEKRDFATPTLYMRAPDGIIFNVKKESELPLIIIPPKSMLNTVSDSKFAALTDIPVQGDEASEVGADYTKLRDLLCKKKFGLADLETLNKILWITHREEYGWLSGQCIRELPSCDLITIDKLWLSATKGKYGFSVQKRLWIDLGGKLEDVNCEHWNQWHILKRFVEKVKWKEEEKIVLDQRAVKGHLPMGLYANLHRDKIYYSWRNRVGNIEEEERRRLEAEIERLRQDLIVEKVRKSIKSTAAEIKPPIYLYLLSRGDL